MRRCEPCSSASVDESSLTALVGLGCVLWCHCECGDGDLLLRATERFESARAEFRSVG